MHAKTKNKKIQRSASMSQRKYNTEVFPSVTVKKSDDP